jgi:hypothetical protein
MPNWIGFPGSTCMPPDKFSMVSTLSMTEHPLGVATALVIGASREQFGLSCSINFFKVFGKVIISLLLVGSPFSGINLIVMSVRVATVDDTAVIDTSVKVPPSIELALIITPL